MGIRGGFVFQNELPHALLNTLFLSGVSSFFALVLGTLYAFLLCRYSFFARSFFLRFSLFSQAVPSILVVLSCIFFFGKGGILDARFKFYLDFRSQIGLFFISSISSFSLAYAIVKPYFLKEYTSVAAFSSENKLEFIDKLKIHLSSLAPYALQAYLMVFLEISSSFTLVSYYDYESLSLLLYKNLLLDGSFKVTFSTLSMIFVASFCIIRIYFIFCSFSKVNSCLPNIRKKLGFFSSLLSVLFLSSPLFFTLVLPLYHSFYGTYNLLNFDFKEIYKVLLHSLYFSFGIPIVSSLIAFFVSCALVYRGKMLFESLFYSYFTIPSVGICTLISYISIVINSKLNFAIPPLLLMLFAYVLKFTAIPYNILSMFFRNEGEKALVLSRFSSASAFKRFAMFFRLAILKFPLLFALIFAESIKESDIVLIFSINEFETFSSKIYQLRDGNFAPYSMALMLCCILFYFIMGDKDEFGT